MFAARGRWSIRNGPAEIVSRWRRVSYLFAREPRPDKWVFLVGCYNSGTTLLHKILAEHPSIGTMQNEGQYLTTELPIPHVHGFSRLWALAPERFYLPEEGDNSINIRKLKKQWAVAYNDVSRPILLEKSPPNAARILWLARHFENSYFVGIVRNGYAVAEGIRRKARQPIEKAIKQWKVSNEIMLRDLQAVPQKIVVRYEDMVEDPRKVAGAVCDFLGIERLSPSLLESEFMVHSVRSKIENKNNSSIARLSADDINRVEGEAGALLQLLGYELLHGATQKE